MLSDASIDLKTAANYVILAKTGITNVPDTVITGHIGVSPIASTAMTGFTLVLDSSGQFSKSTQVTGNVYAASYTAPTGAELSTAVYDMEAAYNDGAGRATTKPESEYGAPKYAGEIGGKTLGPGVYSFIIDVNISNDLTFSGTSEDVFIIRTSKSFIQATNTQVILEGGALAENIFWVSALEYSLAADSHTEGIILAKTAVKFATGASINGRIFAQTAVTLQKVLITQTTC